MENNQQHLEALQDIRQMMKQSNKFLSLSGLSGVFAGIYALIGAYVGNLVITDFLLEIEKGNYSKTLYRQTMSLCILICVMVLLLAILTALIFTLRKAKKNNQKLFDHTAIRLVINMFIPLFAGGVFCLAMVFQSSYYVVLVGPAMLIFYGLALVNSSKYTLRDIRYLGCLEVLVGLTACFFLGYGLWFWAFGFGILHIIYGSIMWYKYDRKDQIN